MQHFKAMNTDMYTCGLPEKEQMEAERWFQSIEQRLSRFRSDSELTQLNDAAGTPFIASPLLYEVVSEAVKYHFKTDGLFNPFLGKVLTEAGYRDSFETLETNEPAFTNAHAATQPIQNVATPPTPPAPQLNPINRSITLALGSALDLGGIAKGWSAEKLALRLQDEGVDQGVVDAGGDIMLWGEVPRLIAVADPLAPDKDIATIQIEYRAGIATSSRLKRKWTAADGSVRHHILDPRTLLSGHSDLVQVTVICPTLTEAEVYAKCALLLGSEKGVSWLEQHVPEYTLIGIQEDRSIITAGSVASWVQNLKGDALYADMA